MVLHYCGTLPACTDRDDPYCQWKRLGRLTDSAIRHEQDCKQIQVVNQVELRLVKKNVESPNETSNILRAKSVGDEWNVEKNK
jgi:hypothetical protein